MGHPNIILLTIDALRADHTSVYGYPRETTPNLAKLTDQFCRFEYAFSVSTHTREAVPALLTGHYPDEAINSDWTLGAESLASYLFDTHTSGAFHSNPYISAAYDYDRSFNQFYDSFHVGNHPFLTLLQRVLDKFIFNRGAYHTRANELNQRSINWIDSIDSGAPFFLWNHYMDVHGPYNPPAGARRFSPRDMSNNETQELYQRLTDSTVSISKNERKLAIDLYDDEIRYVDQAIYDFIESLRKREIFKNSLVFITADHGDAFGERGYYSHPRHLHENLLRIPLLVAGGGRSGTVFETSVSTLDIVPTILFTIGKDVSQFPGDPIQTIEEQVDRAVIASVQGDGQLTDHRRFAIQDTNWKYKLERDETGEIQNEEIYYRDLDKNRLIPKTNLDNTERIIDLKEKLRTHSQGRNLEFDDGRNVGKTVESRLDALGYK